MICPYVLAYRDGTLFHPAHPAHPDCRLDAPARLAQARALLDAWCVAAEDGEALGPLREQTLGWLGS